jgi:hypothetical protein
MSWFVAIIGGGVARSIAVLTVIAGMHETGMGGRL